MIEKSLPRWFVFCIGSLFGSMLLLLIQSPIFFLFGFNGVEAGRLSAGVVLAGFYPIGVFYVKFYERNGLGFHWFYLRTLGGSSKILFDLSWIFIFTMSFLSYVYAESYGFEKMEAKGWLIFSIILLLIFFSIPQLSKALPINSLISIREGRVMFIITVFVCFSIFCFYFLNHGYSPYPLFVRLMLVSLVWLLFLCFRWTNISSQDG